MRGSSDSLPGRNPLNGGMPVRKGILVTGTIAFVMLLVALISLPTIAQRRKGQIAPSFSLKTVTGEIISLKLQKRNAQGKLKIVLTKGKGKKITQKELKPKLILLDFSAVW